MPWSSTPGTPFTWNTAGFTWNSADSGKSWDSAAPFVHTGELLETLNFAEVKNASAGKIFTEAWTTVENGFRSPGKIAAEALGLAELYSSIEAFNPVFAEAFVFSEFISKGTGLPRAEAFAIAENEYEDYGLNKAEALAIAEVMNRSLAWKRVVAENFLFADAYMRNIGLRKAETLLVYDTYLRQGPLIVSDLSLRGDEVTFSNFMINVQTSVPSGYGPFQPFVIGDYDISKALIKITMRRESPSQDLRLLSGKVFIDVADVTDRGSITIASTAGPVSITFTRKFLVPPTVSVTRVGSTGGATPRITNVTKTGFQIELVDSVGTRVTGAANWQAEGY